MQNKYWIKIYEDILHALDHLDAAIARSIVHTVEKEWATGRRE